MYFSGSGAANFEARLYEGQDRFDFIYGQLAESGNGATVGVQRDTGNTNFTQFECNTGGLTPGLQLTFTQPPCNTTPTSTSTPGGPTFTNTPTATSTRTFTRTNTPTITLTPTITPTATATTCVSNIYNITQSTGATIVAGTVDTGNHCDDCATSVNLPFAYQLYNQVFTTASVTSNGQWDFQTADSAFSNTCLPDTAASYAIFPHWDHLRTDTGTGCSSYAGGCGVFTSISGTAPNRIFNIEWRTIYFGNGAQLANFEVRLYEGQQRFDLVYGQVDQSGSNATIGVQKDTGSAFTQFECNTGGITPGLQLTFQLAVCGTNTPTVTSTPVTATPTPSRLLVGHVTWQGAPAQPNARQQQPVTLTLKLGTTEVNYPSMTTDASGFFTVSVSTVSNGTYNWRVKGPKFLANAGSVTLAGAPTTQAEMGLMLAGDANDNNVVNSQDFNILKLQFGSGGSNLSADFNNDGVVNSADFILLRANFGLSGAPPLGPSR